MNVLFITLLDIRDVNEHGLYQDLIREFIRNGHSVYVVSPSERRNKLKQDRYISERCTVLKVKTGNVQKTNLIEKGISTLLIEPQIKHAIKKHFSLVKFGMVLYSTPPVTLVSPVAYIKKRDNAIAYLMLKDIFPQNSLDLCLLRETGLSGIVYRHFKRKERELYKLSDYIGCTSNANIDYIHRHENIPIEQLSLVANAVEPRELTVSERDAAEIRAVYSIPVNAKAFFYGGNLGVPQDIPFVIRCLKQNAGKSDRFFVICGQGTLYPLLEEYVKTARPENVRLLPYLPKNEYDSLVSACDAGLLFLDHRFTVPNCPARFYAYMESAKPIIACTDKSTDIRDDIRDGEFGWWCESISTDDFTRIIDEACRSDLTAMGLKAREYLERKYTVNGAYATIMACLPE